jgi:hypothetical protein
MQYVYFHVLLNWNVVLAVFILSVLNNFILKCKELKSEVTDHHDRIFPAHTYFCSM